MIVNLVEAIGGNVGWSESAGLESGGGCTHQCSDGTWLAWVILDDSNLGLYGMGCTEGTALAALEAKIKSLGGICQGAFAEAEARYKVRKAIQDKEYADRISDILGIDRATPIPSPKKAGN